MPTNVAETTRCGSLPAPKHELRQTGRGTERREQKRTATTRRRQERSREEFDTVNEDNKTREHEKEGTRETLGGGTVGGHNGHVAGPKRGGGEMASDSREQGVRAEPGLPAACPAIGPPRGPQMCSEGLGFRARAISLTWQRPRRGGPTEVTSPLIAGLGFGVESLRAARPTVIAHDRARRGVLTQLGGSPGSPGWGA